MGINYRIRYSVETEIAITGNVVASDNLVTNYKQYNGPFGSHLNII